MVLISFLKLTIIDDVSEIFNLADNLFCKFNKVVSTSRKYGNNIAEVSDTFNFPFIWSERKIVSIRNKILFHFAVSKAVIPLATLALNNGSVSVKPLNFLFQYAVSIAVIPLEMLALKSGSISPKLLNLLFQ